MKDKKIGENEKATFYTNLFCTDFKDGYRIVLAIKKDDKDKNYLLLKDNQPIYESKRIEDVGSKHDIEVINLKFNKKDE